MDNDGKCPLTPALREIAVAMMELGTDDTQALADYLCRTPGSIRTEMKRIYFILDVHTRFQVMYIGLRDGWLDPPPEASTLRHRDGMNCSFEGTDNSSHRAYP